MRNDVTNNTKNKTGSKDSAVDGGDLRRHLSPIEEIISEIAAGRMVILVDDESRENEGDLVIAAEKADTEAVNFMARYGRGLICLSPSVVLSRVSADASMATTSWKPTPARNRRQTCSQASSPT